jgi:hypothetical protein
LIFNSTVNIPAPLVRVMVPLAVVPRPFSEKVSGIGEGVDAGLDATGLGVGEGDGEELVPVEPQATPVRTRAASATNRLNP